MEYPLNIYITAHTLISSLGFGIPENLEAIHNYRSGIRMQEAGLISDHPLLAGMIDSVELEKRAKLMQITDYTRMEQLFILAIQEVISQSGADLREPDCTLLLSTTKGTLGYETLGVPMPITVYATHQPIPMKCCIKTASGFGGCNAALVLSLPDAHLKQKANSQATDKASAPSVYKAVVESGNMVTIRPGAVESKGTTVFSSSETDFAPFIREAYKHLGENNMKFYKMDNLCKLGYVAAEYLLKDTNYHPKEIGIILANASSSLDTDCKHQAIISKEGDKAASPAVFVYTLPNVVLGEICIRHKIQGENTFFVRRQSDAASLEDYARIVMAKGKLRTCIIGWCELLDGHYQAEFKQLNNISTIYG